MSRNFFPVFFVVIAAMMFLFLGCHDFDDILSGNIGNPIPAKLDTEFRLKVNQVAILEDQNIKVEFLDVTEDSRCPSDVVCVWAGQVTVLVKVWENGQDMGNLSLTDQAGDETLNTKSFDDYSIKLVKVDPYPISTQQIRLKDYMATFIVSKK